MSIITIIPTPFQTPPPAGPSIITINPIVILYFCGAIIFAGLVLEYFKRKELREKAKAEKKEVK